MMTKDQSLCLQPLGNPPTLQMLQRRQRTWRLARVLWAVCLLALLTLAASHLNDLWRDGDYVILMIYGFMLIGPGSIFVLNLLTGIDPAASVAQEVRAVWRQAFVEGPLYPVRADQAIGVARACQHDTEVEAYRLAVKSQGRDLTAAEAKALVEYEWQQPQRLEARRVHAAELAAMAKLRGAP